VSPYRKTNAPTPLVRNRWWQTPHWQAAIVFAVTVILLLPAVVGYEHKFSWAPISAASIIAVVVSVPSYVLIERIRYVIVGIVLGILEVWSLYCWAVMV